jgi:cytochrome c oxidase subunit 2
MQAYAAAVSLFFMTVIAATFCWAVRNSATLSTSVQPARGMEWYRRVLFWGLVAVGVLVTLATLRSWPHDVTSSQGAVVVTAIGNQWSWDLSPREVPADRPIIFKVTSSDVNHGFGVYDAAGTILFQTQSMPGYINQVRHVHKAGPIPCALHGILRARAS